MVNVGDWRSAVDGILGRDGSGPDRRDIESFAARLGSSRGSSGLAGPELIDRIAVLERLKAAASAEQARAQVAFAELCAAGDDARAAALERKTGRSAAKVRERSVASQIALARSVAPSKGSRLLAGAKRLVGEMPHTLAALSAGRLNEDRAIWVAEGVEVLSPSDRASVDVELCSDPQRLEGLGDRAVQDAVRASVDAIDDAAQLARVREAEAGRRVTVRRLPDSMAQLTAILPVAQAVAVEGALRQAAAAERAGGGDRTAGQVAADTLVERVTGQAHADAVPLRIGLVMTDASLFAGGRESAALQGYGTITGTEARGMVAAAAGGGSEEGTAPPGTGAASLAGVWLRRLFLDPSTGELAAMDSKARRFPRALADFIEIRDQRCRTPFCDAPIRHIDHVVPAVQGGETSVENGQGLCEACNHVKESPGWEQAVVGGSATGDGRTRGDIVTVAPTSHEYYSPPVKLPGAFPGEALSGALPGELLPGALPGEAPPHARREASAQGRWLPRAG